MLKISEFHSGDVKESRKIAEAALDAFLGMFSADKAIEQAAQDLWNTICIQEYPDGQGKWEELTVIGKSPYYAQVRAVYQQILDLKK